MELPLSPPRNTRALHKEWKLLATVTLHWMASTRLPRPPCVNITWKLPPGWVIIRIIFTSSREPWGLDEQGHPAAEAMALSTDWEEGLPSLHPTLKYGGGLIWPALTGTLYDNYSHFAFSLTHHNIMDGHEDMILLCLCDRPNYEKYNIVSKT